MPKPNPGESKADFVSRCIPAVINDGTTEDPGQAAAICYSLYNGKANLEETNDTDLDNMAEDEVCCPNCGSGEEPCCEADKHPDDCKPGYHMKDGRCQPISVRLSIKLDGAWATAEADTGKPVIRITGTAFHEGINANGWGITKEAAIRLVGEMLDMDITLNHPEPDAGGFSRNMDGGVNEAVVGYITEASIFKDEEEEWEVGFSAEIHRIELFEALESGLWLRDGYGVSIGGTGVPDSIVSHSDGTTEIWFGEDFTLDHLAIVHRPAYERAVIHSVERIESAISQYIEVDETPPEIEVLTEITASDSKSLKYQSMNASNNREANTMTDETIVEDSRDWEAEFEAMQAEIILKNAEIDAFRASEAEKEEAARQTLVDEATEIGLKGHEDLSADVVASLIESWQQAQPEEAPAEMKPVESGFVAEDVVIPEGAQVIVANYLNKQLIETPEPLYARCYNAWVQAWNGTLATDEGGHRAQTYEELNRGGN